jgi:hypothetical protein
MFSSILGRKAHHGTMKTFVPQGAPWHNENICSARHKMAINKPTPEGSHVSSILGRKAHNGTMKTFFPQGAPWYNENICSARHKMAINKPTPEGSHVYKRGYLFR